MTATKHCAPLRFEGSAEAENARLPAGTLFGAPTAAVVLEADWPILSGAAFAAHQATIEAHLPEAARARLSAFQNPARRQQSLKARLGALLLAGKCLGLPGRPGSYQEAPPFGPTIQTGGQTFFLTLAHTEGAYAAALSLTPAGVDVERVRPVKRLADMTAFAYGEAAGDWMRRRLEAASPAEREAAIDDFFALWTLKECEIKMNRTAGALVHRPRVRAVFAETEGAAQLRFEAQGLAEPVRAIRMACGDKGVFRAALLCESAQTPKLGRLTPETLGLDPRDLDAQLAALLAALNAASGGQPSEGAHEETRTGAHMTRPRKHTDFLGTLLAAQRLAFAPFIFKAAAAALSTGLLARVDAKPGLEAGAHAAALGISDYAAVVMTDILLTAGIIEKDETGGLRSTELAQLLLFDDMTRANFFFTDRVNYAGLEKTLDALLEGRPAGLAHFDKDWRTIYPHLTALPEDAQNAWFAFDHFHSDRAYEAAIAALRELPQAADPAAPLVLADIGGNTGRFTRAFLAAFPNARAYFVDLPEQCATLSEREGMAEIMARVRTAPIDWLTDAPLTGTEDADLYWMSQFLDCFSLQEARSILERTRAAMKPGARLLVLEPLVDEQRHQAAALSLAATSLYFTVLANGNSRFFHGAELRQLFVDAGFEIESEHPNLGISHTLFVLAPKA